MSRLRLFLSLVAFAALASVFAACGGGSDNSSADPQEVIDSATLAGVESGNLDLSLGIKSAGKEGGNVDVSLSGPFQSQGKESLPQLAITAQASGSVQGEDVDFEGGLTVLSDRAFVNYKGTEYEVDPTTFGIVKSSLEQAQQGGEKEAGAGDITACQEAATGLEVGNFVDNLENDGSAKVDGTETTKISGDLDVGGAIDALIKLTENPACSSQLEAAGPLPLDELEEAKGELTSAVKKAHAEVYVGDDDIVRKLAGELTVEPKGSDEKVEIEFELALSGVNEEQDITAPAGAKPLEGLFQKLGVNPLELLEVISGEGDFGSLLEEITGGASLGGGSSSGGGGSSSGESSSSGSPGRQAYLNGQQAYLECLKDASTPADLQRCASMVQ